MAEFDRRWRELVDAARRAEPSATERPLAERELAELAALAGPRPPAFSRPAPSMSRGERWSLAAAALVALLAVAALLPDAASWNAFRRSARAELAALPLRVPRAPRVPSAASTLRLLPDLTGLLPLDSDSSR